ncbi:alpha/beta fold hydrolase [Saccharothrix saharensis]|uniref:alpha/beta fold hydrolase n=1 Tax=Saccharothrix saharensis TaxID=571190 RepID=UPI0036BB14AD
MEEHKVIADDGRVLWAAGPGRGEPPLVLCHGDAGPPDAFDGLAALPADRVRVIRWQQRDHPEGTTARAIADLDSVRAHFGPAEMALLGHGGGADVALHYALAHPERVSSLVYVAGAGLDEPELVARCRGLDVPTLIVDGAGDVRPRWAVDSLAEALPDVARVVLPGAGDVPWVGSPGSFGWAVLAHLAR